MDFESVWQCCNQMRAAIAHQRIPVAELVAGIGEGDGFDISEWRVAAEGRERFGFIEVVYAELQFFCQSTVGGDE